MIYTIVNNNDLLNDDISDCMLTGDLSIMSNENVNPGEIENIKVIAESNIPCAYSSRLSVDDKNAIAPFSLRACMLDELETLVLRENRLHTVPALALKIEKH
ncbi:MAG: hypothetical protein ACI9D5_003001 [Candidatus Endobugula sp.]|jgi:hypothetical protein